MLKNLIKRITRKEQTLVVNTLSDLDILQEKGLIKYYTRNDIKDELYNQECIVILDTKFEKLRYSLIELKIDDTYYLIHWNIWHILFRPLEYLEYATDQLIVE